MKQDWDESITFVLKMEGGVVAENDPNDPGGWTKFGISQKAYPNIDIKNLSVEEAREIYRRDYWAPCQCDELPRPFAIAIFDMAVNQGVKTATRTMQIALGVTVDGVIGPKTITAAKKASTRTFNKFLAERLCAYHRLMVAKPNLGVYAMNWFHRTISLSEAVFSQNQKELFS